MVGAELKQKIAAPNPCNEMELETGDKTQKWWVIVEPHIHYVRVQNPPGSNAQIFVKLK